MLIKLNEYFEESNENKYLELVPTNENEDIFKKYEELWSKVEDLINSSINNSDDYDEKYKKDEYDDYN